MVMYQMFDAMYATASTVVFGQPSADTHMAKNSKKGHKKQQSGSRHSSSLHSSNRRHKSTPSQSNSQTNSHPFPSQKSHTDSASHASFPFPGRPHAHSASFSHPPRESDAHHKRPRTSSTKSTPVNTPPHSRSGTPPPSSAYPSASSSASSSTTSLPSSAASFSSTSSTSSADAPIPKLVRDHRHNLVDQILLPQNLYKVLGVDENASAEEIRRAYIARSRVCHPDKLPDYPPATQAFQKLSLSYETLSKASSRRTYDVSGFSEVFSTTDGPTPPAGFQTPGDETLHGVLHQIFSEFMEGDFEMIRVLINALNEGNPGLNIGDETVENLEGTFRKVRETLVQGRVYVRVVKFELIRLYEIQTEMRRLSYFDVFGRLRLTMQLARVTLELPLAIDKAVQEEREKQFKQLSAIGNNRKAPQGLLGERVKKVIGGVVGVLERGERLVGVKA